MTQLYKYGYLAMLMMANSSALFAQQATAVTKVDTTASYFLPGQPWMDSNGELINAHGGGIIYADKKYYWFGEKRGRMASEGVNVYSSTDLYNWKHEALALSPVLGDSTHDIAKGCIMERPKIIYNDASKKYVMWFHLELRGKGYNAARAGVAVSDKITGPYKFVHSFRPNGNMSRDMTLFKDKDGQGYLIYSSRDNYDLRIVKLSDDFLSASTDDKLLFSNHREAPAVFTYKDKYYLITSGCTGWNPNKAAIHESASLWGPWKELPYNPMSGPKADITFEGQSTFVLPVAGRKDSYIFMADKWKPSNLRESSYLWLPLTIQNGQPIVEWKDKWTMDEFTIK